MEILANRADSPDTFVSVSFLPCQTNQTQRAALNPQTLTTNPTISQNHLSQSPNSSSSDSKTPNEDKAKSKAEESLNSVNSSPPKDQAKSLNPSQNLSPNTAEDPVLSNKSLSPTWTQTQP